ncbi:MAG: STAS domain-containing protein [bacterium]
MVMRIQMTREGNVSIIALAGEEDTRSDEAVNKAFRECFEHGSFNVVLDLCRLKYLGSRLRKVLLANTKEALAGGGKIKLLNPQPAVKNYLKENRLLDFFEVYNIRQAALESFANAASPQPEEPALQAHHPVGGVSASLPQGLEERQDRLENSLIQLVGLLRQRGVISDEDEDQIFG